MEKTKGKGAISPFQTVFSTYLDNFSTIFIKLEIVVCKLCQFGRVLKLTFGKGLMNQNLSCEIKELKVQIDVYLWQSINPLPDDKILEWSKLKQIADNILKYI